MVVVEVRQGTLGVDGRGWGPAGNTGRGWSWLRSGRAYWAWMVVVEVRQGAGGEETRRGEEKRGEEEEEKEDEKREEKEEDEDEEEATDIKSNNPHLAGGEIPIQWPMIINDPNGCVSKYVYPLKWPCQLATWWCRQGAQVFHACIVLTKPLVQLPNCHGPGISFLLSPQPQELSQFSVLNNHLVVSQNPGTRMVPKIAG